MHPSRARYMYIDYRAYVGAPRARGSRGAVARSARSTKFRGTMEKFAPLNLSPQEIIEYTPEWDGERFADGRPKVSDDILERMVRFSSYLHFALSAPAACVDLTPSAELGYHLPDGFHTYRCALRSVACRSRKPGALCEAQVTRTSTKGASRGPILV